MATPSNPSGIVPNADEVSTAPKKNKTPTNYDEYYNRIQRRTWSLYKKIKSDDARIDVDKKLMEILEDVEEIQKFDAYKGKKDPVWGLLDSTYEGIVEGYDKATGNARYKSENLVLPNRKTDANKGALKAKVRGQVLADYNATVENRRLKPGQSANATRTPNKEPGGVNDSESGNGISNGKENEWDIIPASQQKKNQEEVNKIKIERDADGNLLPSDKERLTSQKKIADKALETGKWYGINKQTNMLYSWRNRSSRPLKPTDEDLLKKISSKLETVLTTDAKEIEVERLPDEDVETDGLLRLDQQTRPKADSGGNVQAQNAARRRNMEASLRNSVQGPLIPSAVDDALAKRKEIADLKMMPQLGGPVYSPNAAGLNAETGVRERLNSNVRTPIAVAQGDTRIPEFMADYERSAGRNSVGVIPEIDRMPPAPAGGRFEPPPIRLNGPEAEPLIPQQVNRVSKVVQPTYNPDDVPLAEYTSENNARVNREFTPRGTPPPPPQQPPARQPAIFPDVNQPMTMEERKGVQERMGYSPKPEVNPNAGIRPDGAGPLISPVDVNATASGLGPEFTENAPKPTQFENMRNYRSDPKNQMMEADRVRANNVRSGNLKGPFETQLDSASNTEVLSDNDTRIAKAEAQLEDLPEKRRKQIRARIKKIGGLTTGLVGIIAAGTASAARYTGTDAGNATADYIEAGMESYVDNVTMRGYEELGADREKMLGSDLSLTQDISRGIIPDTIADVAGLAGLISSG